MIVKPKVRGFISTTAHPKGCAKNVEKQISFVKNNPKKINQAPKNVLIIGSSTGYGLATRIVSAFGSGSSTIGVCFEKEATDKKTATAGLYNTVAFEDAANAEGLYAKTINADAFSDETKETVIDLIKKDLGKIDCVIYSLASPVRKMPESGELIKSTLKPIGKPYIATAVDTNKDQLFEAKIEPATQQEIDNTVTVMGGDDWSRWIHALQNADVLSKGCLTLAYSYIGGNITWPIYWEGTIGQAKKDLTSTAKKLNKFLEEKLSGHAHVAVLKSVVTQASAAIPVMPLYLSMVFKKMKQEGIHEGCIEQIFRMFESKLFKLENQFELDNDDQVRLDDWELREDVQNFCKLLWPNLTNDNLFDETDYQYYKDEFMKLFGFNFDEVNYDEDTDIKVNISEI
ncbi:trans-2-enoyl-CoA reductase [Paraphotobacterium marinum]|uniref:Enoyl-[acyl-carrier-protein] reductase [NADH] n=1 Tax=Paraphotobacterium marinum TaxID=1755811 RepID=A0A220VFB0_9GAMM|nr:enoyl-ACP reductase FabV [Paraphotobacterium marinum]ASK78623.1 trans-2-enoyl-CoA reductase [Paraphotobacterium marinum]